MAGLYGNFLFNSLRNHPPSCFQKRLHGFTFPPVMYEVRVVLCPYHQFGFCGCCVCHSRPNKHGGAPTAVSVCISLMTKVVEQLFVYLLPICTSSLEKCVLKSFVRFLIGLFIILSFRYKSVYIFWIRDPFKKHDLEIFTLIL